MFYFLSDAFLTLPILASPSTVGIKMSKCLFPLPMSEIRRRLWVKCRKDVGLLPCALCLLPLTSAVSSHYSLSYKVALPCAPVCQGLALAIDYQLQSSHIITLHVSLQFQDCQCFLQFLISAYFLINCVPLVFNHHVTQIVLSFPAYKQIIVSFFQHKEIDQRNSKVFFSSYETESLG